MGWIAVMCPEFRVNRPMNYFSVDGVNALRRRHQDGQARVGQELSAVLGVQVWHDLFRRGRQGCGGVPCVTG